MNWKNFQSSNDLKKFKVQKNFQSSNDLKKFFLQSPEKFSKFK